MITLTSQIAQSVREDFRLRKFSELKAYAAERQPVSLARMLASERFASNLTPEFTLTGDFTTLVASSPSQLGKLRVTLTVSWHEHETPLSCSLTTYFAEKGISD